MSMRKIILPDLISICPWQIADALGVNAQFVTTGYDALYDALTVGRADIIISALYPDPSRTAAFAYSTPYFNGGDVAYCR